MSVRSDAFERLCLIMEKLRGENGCPWDKEQTPESLRTYFIEETFEAIDAINEGNSDHVKEELGDVFFNLVFQARCFEEQNKFKVEDSLNEICDKLERRHPHVFGEKKLDDSEKVNKQWDKIKEEVEGRKSESVLDQVPKGFPPLLKAYKIQKKVAKEGFVWPDKNGYIKKIEEELLEVKEEIENKDKEKLEDEIGDLLMSVVSLSRSEGVDPTVAMEKAIQKFSTRFKFVESKMKEENLDMRDEKNSESMLSFWKEAKAWNKA